MAHHIRWRSRGVEFEAGTPHGGAGQAAAAGASSGAGGNSEVRAGAGEAPAGFDVGAFRAAFGKLVGQEAPVDRIETAGKGSVVLGTRFPVACDPSGARNDAAGVRAWPTAYAIGRDGRGTWEGTPHFAPGEPEAALHAALSVR